jgi:hypothetical protein
MIKNQGEDDIRWALAFNGAIGQFKDLPKLSDMTDDICKEVKSLQWFMKQQSELPLKPFSGFGAARDKVIEELKQTT